MSAKDSENDLSGKVGLDISDFKANISALNQQIKVVETGFKAAAAGMGDWGSTADGLQARIKSLTDVIALQQQKVDNLKEIYAKVAAEKGATSKAAQDLQIRINNETAALNKNQFELKTTTEKLDNLGSGADKAGDNLDQFGKDAKTGGDKVERAGKQAKESGNDAEKGNSGWSKLGSGISKAGEIAGKAVIGMGTAAAGAAAAVGGMTLKAAESADDINTLAKQTGLSTEEIQKFQYATKLIDVPLDTLTGSMAKLTKNMASAQNGTGAASDAFKSLGVSVTDSNGQLRSNQDVFNDAINALGKMENGTQRDAYAMAIFGKSAQDLNPLILGGADALKKYGDQAEAAGLILGQDSLDKLNKLNDAMDTLKATASGSGSLFATAFAGPMADGVNEVTEYMTRLTSAFNKGGFEALSDEIGSVLGDIVAKLSKKLPELIQMGLNIVTKLVEGISQNLPAITSASVKITTMLVESLVGMLPQLIEMGIQVIVQLALGIAEALPQLVPSIVDAVLTIVQALIDNLDLLVDAALKIILALAEGLIQALPVLIQKAPEIIAHLVTAIINNLPALIGVGVQVVVALASAIVQNLPKLLAAGVKIVAALVGSLAELPAKMLEVGVNMVSGVWSGIVSNVQWLKNKIKGWVGDVLTFIKNLFGIHSPSTVMAGYGGYLSEGLANGITDKAGLVKNAMGSLSGMITGSQTFNATVAGAGSSGGYGLATTNLYIGAKQVASETSPVQYTRNNSKARSLGVVVA